MAEVTDPQRDFSSALLSQYRGRTMRRGTRSKTTRALQLFLREKGFDIAADGVYGPQTERAVRAWQKQNGLSADGQAGRRTLTKIREQITPRPKERPTAVPGGDFAPVVTPSTRAIEPEATRLGASSGPVADAGVGSVRPPPSFEPTAMPAGLGRGGPPPGMPPAGPVEAAGSLPAPPPVSTTGPLTEAPVPPPTSIGGTGATVPSDLNPEQMGQMREAQGIGPFPPRPGYPAQDTGLARALAAGGGPNNQLLFPEPAAGGGDLPITGEMTPETIAMIQALLQGRAGGQPPPTAGY